MRIRQSWQVEGGLKIKTWTLFYYSTRNGQPPDNFHGLMFALESLKKVYEDKEAVIV